MSNVKNNQSVNNQSSTQEYINNHARAFCYINSVYDLVPEKGGKAKGTSTWLRVVVLHGHINDPLHVSYNVRVVGNEMLSLVNQFRDKINQQSDDGRSTNKVAASIVMGDLYPESYEVKNGKDKGKLKLVIKSRLIGVKTLKINDEIVFKELKPQTDVDQTPPQVNDQVPEKLEVHEFNPHESKSSGEDSLVDVAADDGEQQKYNQQFGALSGFKTQASRKPVKPVINNRRAA